MDVCNVELVEADKGVDHRPRLLRAGRVTQGNLRLAVDVLC
jgi:hypothetical protein